MDERLIATLLWGGIGLDVVTAAIAAWVIIQADNRAVDICIGANPEQCGL